MSEDQTKQKPTKQLSLIPIIAMLTVGFYGLHRFGFVMPPWIVGLALGFFIFSLYRSVGYKGLSMPKVLMDSVVVAYFAKLLAILSAIFLFS